MVDLALQRHDFVNAPAKRMLVYQKQYCIHR